jgi:hypothetical protein
MAAAVLASRHPKVARVGSSLRDNHIELIPMPLLPDKKEWLAEHDIEMLMLDGYETFKSFVLVALHLK